MGVASGRGQQDAGVASGWNLRVWLECIGVASGCCKEVYVDILLIVITFFYSTCISSFFGSSIPTSLFVFPSCRGIHRHVAMDL